MPSRPGRFASADLVLAADAQELTRLGVRGPQRVPMRLDPLEERWTIVAIAQPTLYHATDERVRQPNVLGELRKELRLEAHTALLDDLPRPHAHLGHESQLVRGLRPVLIATADKRGQRHQRHELACATLGTPGPSQPVHVAREYRIAERQHQLCTSLSSSSAVAVAE